LITIFIQYSLHSAVNWWTSSGRCFVQS